MPKQVLPDAADFAWFEGAMRRSGFSPISDRKFIRDWHRLKLQAPRPRPGREAGFFFVANGLIVRVWTTWLHKESEAREVDAGWVLIAKGDDALYFKGPMLRTRNFFLTLARRAWITAWRVAHRPHCPACNAFMEIARGHELKSRYWRCDLLARHKDGTPRWYKWDIGLPPRAQKFVDAWRTKRARYEAARIAAGENPHAAMLKRKPWKLGGTPNP
jgi:hypothetical protein